MVSPTACDVFAGVVMSPSNVSWQAHDAGVCLCMAEGKADACACDH